MRYILLRQANQGGDEIHFPFNTDGYGETAPSSLENGLSLCLPDGIAEALILFHLSHTGTTAGN